jgi:hypothetical protein
MSVGTSLSHVLVPVVTAEIKDALCTGCDPSDSPLACLMILIQFNCMPLHWKNITSRS